MPSLREFMTDPALEKDGRWVDYRNGARFKIARWNNPAHRAEIERLREPHLKEARKGELAAELAEELNNRAASSCVLLDWENITDAETGEAVAYTPELGFQALSDPRLRDVMLFVYAYAMQGENYRLEAEADARKN